MADASDNRAAPLPGEYPGLDPEVAAAWLASLAGAELEDAQAMARHSDISTTMIYSHHVDRLARAAEDRVSELLDGDG